MKIAVPILETEVNGKKLINAHFGRTNLFAVVDTESGKIEVKENPTLQMERGKGVYIAELFKRNEVEAVLVKEVGPGAFDKLTRMGIRIYQIPENVKFLDEAVEMFKKGELKQLLEPNG